MATEASRSACCFAGLGGAIEPVLAGTLPAAPPGFPPSTLAAFMRSAKAARKEAGWNVLFTAATIRVMATIGSNVTPNPQTIIGGCPAAAAGAGENDSIEANSATVVLTNIILDDATFVSP
jgi:hypothetical protein